MKIISTDQTLTFGKHKGALIKDIILEDPQYLLWCSIHIGWLDVDIKIREMCANSIEISKPKSTRFRDGSYGDDWDTGVWGDDSWMPGLAGNYDL